MISNPPNLERRVTGCLVRTLAKSAGVGLPAGKRLVEKLLSGNDRRCLFFGDFLPDRGGEIEDVFPRDTYLDAVKAAYPSFKTDFTVVENAFSGVVNQVTALFERKGLGKFEQWRVAAVLRDRILQAPDAVDRGTLEVVAAINVALNRLLT